MWDLAPKDSQGRNLVGRTDVKRATVHVTPGTFFFGRGDYESHARCRGPGGLRRTSGVDERTVDADVQQGRRSHPVQELHELPSAGRNRPDAAGDLSRTRAPGRKSIATRVTNGTMPPWHADPPHGQFLNDRSLKAADATRS